MHAGRQATLEARTAYVRAGLNQQPQIDEKIRIEGGREMDNQLVGYICSDVVHVHTYIHVYM